MGDRGNIVVQESLGKRVYFYTHWQGSEVKSIVKKALSREQRWDDASYLARIIFSTLVPQEQWNKETGFGISASAAMDAHTIIVVDVASQSVWLENTDGNKIGEATSFSNYII